MQKHHSVLLDYQTLRLVVKFCFNYFVNMNARKDFYFLVYLKLFCFIECKFTFRNAQEIPLIFACKIVLWCHLLVDWQHKTTLGVVKIKTRKRPPFGLVFPLPSTSTTNSATPYKSHWPPCVCSRHSLCLRVFYTGGNSPYYQGPVHRSIQAQGADMPSKKVQLRCLQVINIPFHLELQTVLQFCHLDIIPLGSFFGDLIRGLILVLVFILSCPGSFVKSLKCTSHFSGYISKVILLLIF